jgi:hypothetical protein
MNYEEWNQGIEDAKSIMERADRAANTLARTVRGRLRKVDTWVLVELKRELHSFNAQTRRWKEST